MTKKFRFGALFLAMIILCTTFVLPTASANVNVGNVTINTIFDRVIISGTADPNSNVEAKILDEWNNLVVTEFVTTDDIGNFTFYRHVSEFTNGSEKYSVEIDGENFGEFTPPGDMPGSVIFFAESMTKELRIDISCPITEDMLIEVKRYKSETIFSYEYKLSEHADDIEYGKYYHETISGFYLDSAEYTLYFNGIEWDTVVTESMSTSVHNLCISKNGGSVLISGKTDSSNGRVYLEIASETSQSYYIDTYSSGGSFSESLDLPNDKYYVRNYHGEELGFFILKNPDEALPTVTKLSGKFENGFWRVSGEADSAGYIYLSLKCNYYTYNCKFRVALNEETGKAQFERKIYVGSVESATCQLTANGESREFYSSSYSASGYVIVTPDAEKITIRGELPKEQQLSEEAELELVNASGNVLYSSSVPATDAFEDCIYLNNDIDMPAGDYYIMIDGAEYEHFKMPGLSELLFTSIVHDNSSGEVRICGTTEPNRLIKTRVAVDTFSSNIPYTTISDTEGNFEILIPNQQKSGTMSVYINSDTKSENCLTFDYTGVLQPQIILAEINSCSSAESMKSTIEKWADIINVNIDKINLLRNPIRIYKMMLGNKFSSIENVARYIDEQVLLESIAECESWTECESIVRQNLDLISIDTARLDSLTNSSQIKIYRSIAGKRFNDISELSAYLDTAIKNELSSGGSTSGSGGGSSGGNNTSGSMLIGYVKSSLPSGCYFAGENVIKLSYSSENADIYYTIDGSEPTAESIKYTGEIPLTEDIAIKAIAVVDGAKTAVETFSYTVAEKIDGIKVMQVLGNSAVLSIGALKDADSISFHSTNSDETWDVSASFNEDRSMATVYGLQPKSTVYIIIDAKYPDGTKTTRTEYFCTEDEISSDCELEALGIVEFMSVFYEAGAIIDSDNMTATNIKLPNKYEKAAFYAEVSNGAEYAFYPSKYSNTPYAENIVPLKEGKNVFYIKITASDKVTKKVYKITAYRNTKSDKPQIEIKDGKAYITAAEGARIFYTTDNSPVNMMLAAEYSEGFEVCPGMIIRAVAAETGKDEVSDEAILSLDNNDYKAIIDIIDCSDNAKYADYELNIVSTEKTDALLICAEYKGGRLAGLEMMPMSLLAGDNAVSKRFTRTAENSEFKLMLWGSAESMKPLALPQR